ncbi:MAG: hypothetical protein IKR13_06965 [Victivallales bacterium]|nr:hypothetical protein [Victivallales bacterium]
MSKKTPPQAISLCISETAKDATSPEQVGYYLDDHDQLHVPKLTVDQLATWR